MRPKFEKIWWGVVRSAKEPRRTAAVQTVVNTNEENLRTSAAATEEELKAAIDRVTREYAEFIPIMPTEASLELPKHSDYDHAIDFKDNTTPPWGAVYPLNETELEELCN